MSLNKLLSVGGAADILSDYLGVPVKPRWITNPFYDRELRDDLCPIVGGRRLIPRDYLPMIESALKQRGMIGQFGEEEVRRSEQVDTVITGDRIGPPCPAYRVKAQYRHSAPILNKTGQAAPQGEDCQMAQRPVVYEADPSNLSGPSDLKQRSTSKTE